MSIINKKIALLVDNYFEQVEFELPKRLLEEEGADVTIIGARSKDLQGMNHANKGDTFQADTLLEQATPTEYDVLLLPGGVMNADTLRMIEAAREWVDSFIDEKKLIAAICHAPWLLVSTDVVEERRLTSYYTLQDDILNAGGEWIDQPVVIDKNLITSRRPDDIEAFIAAIKTWFEVKNNI